jgi:hypothetical protein
LSIASRLGWNWGKSSFSCKEYSQRPENILQPDSDAIRRMSLERKAIDRRFFHLLQPEFRAKHMIPKV